MTSFNLALVLTVLITKGSKYSSMFIKQNQAFLSQMVTVLNRNVLRLINRLLFLTLILPLSAPSQSQHVNKRLLDTCPSESHVCQVCSIPWDPRKWCSLMLPKVLSAVTSSTAVMQIPNARSRWQYHLLEGLWDEYRGKNLLL